MDDGDVTAHNGAGEQMGKRSTVRVPPRVVRVLVVTPVVFVATGAVTLLAPLLHAALALVDLLDRMRWRFTRIGGLGIALCVCEFLGLLATFGLWVASGFGLGMRTRTMQRAHNRVFGWWLEAVTRALRFYLGFDFVLSTTERIFGPVLTFARHAGPGDAFLLARTVIQDYRRQLRMVGATKLLWDPFISHMMLRLPHHFLDPDPTDPAADLEAIERLCATMDDDSVLIIFPEGGNWTPRRWQGAIDALHESGRAERADRATRMTHVLPPRVAGAAAALHARNDLTVVFVVHVGLGDLHSLRQIWRSIPLEREVRATYWSVPAEELPTDSSDVGDWLFEQWVEVDAWISANRPAVYGTGATGLRSRGSRTSRARSRSTARRSR
ncbi:MAG: 1-acyl-sn-glycerol-3-phosphate acyltransferase [Ilumatobacteraceae bacterium]